MSQTNINIRIDENLKKQFDKLCEELGLTMTSAVNIFAKAMVRQQAIPFEISLKTGNVETLKAMEDVNNGKNLSRTFTNSDDLFEDLNA